MCVNNVELGGVVHKLSKHAALVKSQYRHPLHAPLVNPAAMPSCRHPPHAPQFLSTDAELQAPTPRTTISQQRCRAAGTHPTRHNFPAAMPSCPRAAFHEHTSS